MTPLVITIDGPAGAGKSTTARRVAEELGYTYVDSGAMYRAVTLAVIQKSVPLTEEGMDSLCKSIRIELRPSPDGQQTLLDGVNVSADIRRQEVTDLVSPVSQFHAVRTKMVSRQREMGLHGGIVMDGRDIGSVVFPNAHVKVFLVADLEERARRRYNELTASGAKVELDAMQAQLAQRDKLDSERDEGPLVQPKGAVVIDTTHMSVDQQVQAILQLVHDYQRTDSLVSKYFQL
ncbi:MAG: (d)CMP kinase [Bradyrhizobiaceae bacterium]|nr:(d)CMP kinase [Bradyrhizobiaceae bacterium]